jgi:hypothetical protein
MTIFRYNLNYMIFVIAARCVLCEVRTEMLNVYDTY